MAQLDPNKVYVYDSVEDSLQPASVDEISVELYEAYAKVRTFVTEYGSGPWIDKLNKIHIELEDKITAKRHQDGPA